MSKHCLCINGHEIVQTKLRVLKKLTDRNEYNINDPQSGIVEELIHVETDAIMLSEGACKSGQPDHQLGNGQNQNENMIQTEVQIEPGPRSLKKSKVSIAKIIFTCKRCRIICMYKLIVDTYMYFM